MYSLALVQIIHSNIRTFNFMVMANRQNKKNKMNKKKKKRQKEWLSNTNTPNTHAHKTQTIFWSHWMNQSSQAKNETALMQKIEVE